VDQKREKEEKEVRKGKRQFGIEVSGFAFKNKLSVANVNHILMMESRTGLNEKHSCWILESRY
jgi:hypothetical protein